MLHEDDRHAGVRHEADDALQLMNDDRVGAGACTTDGLGAMLGTVGYLYAITDKTNVHVVGYRIFNDDSARYVTFPPFSANAPGADTMGIGLGIIHVLKAGILGK